MNEGTTESRSCRICGVTVGAITFYDDGTGTFVGNEHLATAADGAPPYEYRCKTHATTEEPQP